MSAFLLFQVQPILARNILPWFGGTAAVWSTCLAFFQVALVLGYLYATWLCRYLGPKQQARLHAALLSLSALLLPVTPSASWKPQANGDPTSQILGLLAATVGLPYLLLSATGPLLQTWYARRDRDATPYRLFALSNTGSMLALLTYPVLVEPLLSTRHQALAWSAGYVAFLLLCAWATLRQRNGGTTTNLEDATEAVEPPGWGLHMLWLALPACASILLVAVTSHLSQDVAPVPFLWVLPLALYLISFVVCFEGDNRYRRSLWLPLLTIALAGISYAVLGDYELWFRLRILIPLIAAGFFICCMFCHGELASLKPHRRYLTSFYLMCASGGAAGGVFAGLLAPRLFKGYLELPLGLAGCAILVLVVLYHDPGSRLHQPRWRVAWVVLIGGVAALSGYLVTGIRDVAAESRVMVRNFYGVLRVIDDETESGEAVRKLLHGTINHGAQLLDPQRRHAGRRTSQSD